MASRMRSPKGALPERWVISVVAPNFFEGAQMLITRKIRNGTVVNQPAAVDRNTALKMMTNWAAWAVLREDKIGSLEPGKFAVSSLHTRPTEG